MNKQVKLILALQQIENIGELLKDNQWQGFLSSHLLPVKYELERQLSLLTNSTKQIKIKE